MAERFLGGLATVVSRRRRAVVVVWLALLAAGGWFSLHQSVHLSGGGWEVPGSPSLRVGNALTSDFTGATAPAFLVFVTNPEGPPGCRRCDAFSRANRPFGRADRSSSRAGAQPCCPSRSPARARTRSTRRPIYDTCS